MNDLKEEFLVRKEAVSAIRIIELSPCYSSDVKYVKFEILISGTWYSVSKDLYEDLKKDFQ